METMRLLGVGCRVKKIVVIPVKVGLPPLAAHALLFTKHGDPRVRRGHIITHLL
jgi:hypothetical protein